MALSRRSGQRFSANIWPGFVDAMTALLLVLMFVLTIFMIVQFVLSETITSQDTELEELSTQIESLAQALGLEQQRAFQLEEEVGQLGSELSDERAAMALQATLIETLRTQATELQARIETQAGEIAGFRARMTSFEEQVAALLAERRDLTAANTGLSEELATAEAENLRILSEQEALQLALARAREEVDAQAETARLAAARREALEALIADLRADASGREATLRETLAALEGARGTAEAEAQKTATLEAEMARLQGEMSAAEQARLAEVAAALALRERLAEVEATLSAGEQERLVEAAAAERLREELAGARNELTAMTLALEEERRAAEETLTLLAAARAAEKAAVESLSGGDRNAVLLAEANAQLAEQEAKSAESQRAMALLNEQAAALRRQVASLQALLDDAAARDVERDVQIEALGSELNTALARVAAEQKRRAELEEAERKRLEAEAENLERYRSEFFGQLRDVLGNRAGVRIVGDRFVFSSEVLFAPGSPELSAEGRAEIAKVAAVIRDVADQIPPELDWIIRVDGHTDDVPIGPGSRFADNWELSQARALSVVRLMEQGLGIPPERLAATGFGEYQPVSEQDTPEARAQNRRIELKLTEQ